MPGVYRLPRLRRLSPRRRLRHEFPARLCRYRRYSPGQENTSNIGADFAFTLADGGAAGRASDAMKTLSRRQASAYIFSYKMLDDTVILFTPPRADRLLPATRRPDEAISRPGPLRRDGGTGTAQSRVATASPMLPFCRRRAERDFAIAGYSMASGSIRRQLPLIENNDAASSATFIYSRWASSASSGLLAIECRLFSWPTADSSMSTRRSRDGQECDTRSAQCRLMRRFFTDDCHYGLWPIPAAEALTDHRDGSRLAPLLHCARHEAVSRRSP